ncbi:cell division protein ZapA [bacterium]|nr:cell division protein ZapA [bacterium]
MSDTSNLVKVSILGQDYTVKAPADATYIKEVAEYVNEKMKEVQDSIGPDQSSTRIAILAAMNISDELFSIRKNKDNISSNIGGRISSLIDLIDESLATP